MGTQPEARRTSATSSSSEFQGPAFGDLERLANVGETLGMTVEVIARGRDARFVLAGICWVELPFAWLRRCRRLNTIFERSKEHLIAFVAIAFISILARRPKRLSA